jgi:hypothetical protein|nr:MAG TPA: tail protein [Caudoviricetes sp.]
MRVYLDDFELNNAENLMYLDEPIEGVSGLPNIRSATGVNQGRDGSWVSRQLYEGRYISFQGRIFGGEPIDVENKRRELVSVLQRKKLKLRIITYAGMEFVTEVFVMANQMPINRELNIVKWKIDLLSEDPLFYDNSAGELLATVGKVMDGGFDIPFDIPFNISAGGEPSVVTNSGNETVYPIITISTPATNPKLINRATNEFMQVMTTVLEGDKLIIDMRNKTITHNGLNIYSLQRDGSTFFGLVPGVNVMEIQSDIASENSKAEVRYQSGFLGI